MEYLYLILWIVVLLKVGMREGVFDGDACDWVEA